MSLSLFFKPNHNYFLERIGKENDGGYLINSEAILKSDYLLSFGIFDDWSFEKSFKKYNKNAKIFCYDDIISLNFIFTRSITPFKSASDPIGSCKTKGLHPNLSSIMSTHR